MCVCLWRPLSPAPRPAEPPQGGQPRPGGRYGRYSRCAGPGGRCCEPLLPPAGSPGGFGGGGRACEGSPVPTRSRFGLERFTQISIKVALQTPLSVEEPRATQL